MEFPSVDETNIVTKNGSILDTALVVRNIITNWRGQVSELD